MKLEGRSLAKQFSFDGVAQCLVPTVLLVCIATSGCGSSGRTVPSPTDSSMLSGIKRIYMLASRDLDRPPKNMDELKAILAPATNDPSQYLRSTRDGEEFVVVWGIKLGDAPADSILAYERTGVDGNRMAVTLNGDVREVTQQEFDELEFPKDHQRGGD